jgi:hypothetical protein
MRNSASDSHRMTSPRGQTLVRRRLCKARPSGPCPSTPTGHSSRTGYYNAMSTKLREKAVIVADRIRKELEPSSILLFDSVARI